MTATPRFGPGDPGDWTYHHHLLPDDMPGDFTPVQVGEHHGEEHAAHGPLAEVLEYLGLSGDHDGGPVTGRSPDREAGQ